jgi:hypothetical protein
MYILHNYLNDKEFGELARNIKEKYIKMFLAQLVELPITDVNDIVDVVDIVGFMGDDLFNIVENDWEIYKTAAAKLGDIFLKYKGFSDYLEKLQRGR